jgi:hypothetical protein
MKRPLFAISLLGLVLLAGCNGKLYDFVSEDTTDPTISSPQVNAFASLSGIQVSWGKDDDADGYIVYRRVVTSTTTIVAYQGSSTSFLDATALPDTMYAYTMAKYRGQKVFAVGGQAIGAWDQNYVQDPNGMNDTHDTAIGVSYNTVCDRIFYYSAIDASTSQQVLLSDVDWFYVDLGPRLQMFFSFSYSNIAQENHLTVSTTTDTDPGNTTEISVFNPDTVSRRIYFNVHYDRGTASTSTQVRVDYQLQYLRTAPYNPTN